MEACGSGVVLIEAGVVAVGRLYSGVLIVSDVRCGSDGEVRDCIFWCSMNGDCDVGGMIYRSADDGDSGACDGGGS